MNEQTQPLLDCQRARVRYPRFFIGKGDVCAKRFENERSWSWAQLVYIYARTGQQAHARLALAELERSNRHQPLDPAAFIGPYIGMGNKDQALAYLEKASSRHSNALTTLKVDPIHDSLRSDPRFQDLLRRIGLAQCPPLGFITT